MSRFNTIILGNAYGKNLEYSTDPAETGLNNNMVVVGGSGSGKTMSVMEMKILRNQGRSMIINVTKKNLIRKYSWYLRKKGFDVQVLDMAHPKQGTVCFDPLHYVHGLSDIVGIQNLAKSIVGDTDSSVSDGKYWNESAMHLLMAEICYVLTQDRTATFLDVLKYHDDMTITETAEGFETNHDNDFESLLSINPACRYWKTFRNNAERTAACIFSSLNSPLQTMFPDEIRRTMHDREQVNVCGLAQKPTVLFVYTSPVNKQMHALANMFMSFAIKDLYEYAETLPSGTLPIPVDLVFDDFACGSRVQMFPEYISIFREKGMSTTIMLQSETQLEAMYNQNDAKIILDNCDTYLYMGGMNLENARRIASWCDFPDRTVLRLSIGKVIMLRRGEAPILADRYDIMNDPEYQRVTQAYQKMQENRGRWIGK